MALCSEGKVTALAAGSAEITVSSADGLHSAKCTVTVEEKNPILKNKRYDPLTGLPTYTPVFEEGVSYVEYNTKLVRHIFATIWLPMRGQPERTLRITIRTV